MGDVSTYSRLGLGLGLGLCCEYFGSAIGQLGTATEGRAVQRAPHVYHTPRHLPSCISFHISQLLSSSGCSSWGMVSCNTSAMKSPLTINVCLWEIGGFLPPACMYI